MFITAVMHFELLLSFVAHISLSNYLQIAYAMVKAGRKAKIVDITGQYKCLVFCK